ncbi:hypothetical protein EXU85_20220 [Spirosoma sp. KCTC 42546]|uniref:hypothetical protein n=1 Tax=Spirosoma sp. KCTC 42546 TaxID=2520506 RepID=UPI001158539A|nr:hypothetical protein [Spirosoma sp. KCTC 42546]QDK80805.1 hypothetical protein EXU85_20220 [Spirosoma sp. KCTC 42546]
MLQATKEFTQPDGSVVIWAYDGEALSCDESLALFNTYTYEQKKAAVTTTRPVLATGFSGWKLRDCAGGGGSTLGNFSLDPSQPVIEGGDTEPGQPNDSLNS